MGEYVPIIDEQKRRANDTDIADFLRQRGEKLLPSGRDKRLSSDHSITVRGNQWYDHSVRHGGYAIDFVRQFYSLSYPEAVTMLIGGTKGGVYAAHENMPEPKKPFSLPTAHSDMYRVFAYLTQERFIDREVVNLFAEQKLIYESYEKSKNDPAKYHNAVFVGIDEHGVPYHAHKRGIGGVFKGNVESSDPAYSFHYVGTGNHLYIFEAPVDLLSYITLHPENWQQHSYVALCGISEHAMLKMLELYPRLNHVVLCLDHDPAGIEAAAKLHDILAGKSILSDRELPIHKDWNEDLQATRNLPVIHAEEHHQQLLYDELFAELAGKFLSKKVNCTVKDLSTLLTKARSHLCCGRFFDAKECLLEILRRSVAAAAKEYRQMQHSRDYASVQTRLWESFKIYENHGNLNIRLDLLEAEIMSLRSYKRILTATEKENLAERYETIATHCLKAVLLIE